MDLLALLRMVGGLGVVLGLMAGALWVVRRYDIKLPGSVGARADRRLAIVERIAIDQRRSLALIRRDDREHLVLISPDGAVVVEGGILPDQHRQAAEESRRADEKASAARAEADAAKVRAIFANLVEKANAGASARPCDRPVHDVVGKVELDA